jgi:hypothetical protein
MRAPPVHRLLAAWEHGQAEPPRQRALLLLAAACDDATPEELAQWTIGRRDAALLELRERLFGADLKSWTSCPQCAERVEFQLHARALLDHTPAPFAETRLVHGENCEAEFRLPTSLDLEVLVAGAPVEENRARLLSRCVLAVHRHGEPLPAGEWPPALAETIAARMAEADPRSDLRLALACPACAHAWQTAFDIVSYLWSEVHAWAVRLLREVHELARAYGWSEPEILALSPFRRQQYLSLVRG